MTVLLAFVTAIGPVTMDMYLASIPHIAQALQCSTAAVQLTMSAYVLGFASGQVIYGPLSDHLGRRPVLLVSLGLYLVATAFCASVSVIGLLIAARLVQGIAASGGVILARTIVRDLHAGTKAARQLGLMTTIVGVTPFIAPVGGGFLQSWFGWRASFAGMELLIFPVVLCALLVLPETNRHPQPGAPSFRSVFKGFGEVLKNPAYRSYVGLTACCYTGIFAFLSGSSHVLQTTFGLSPEAFGLIFAMCSMSYIIGTFIGTRIVERLGLEGMIRLGATLVLMGGVLQVVGYWAAPHFFLAMIAPQMLYYFGSSFMTPQVSAGAALPFPKRAGAAISLMGFIQMSVASLVGALLGMLLRETAWPLVSFMCVAAIATFTLCRTTSALREREVTRLAVSA